jgi:hypothetical protein
MNEDVKFPDDIVEFVKKIISDELDDLKVIKIHYFDNDEQAHDEGLQNRVRREFSLVFNELSTKISACFGDARFAEEYDEFDCVPLCGAFPIAVWEIDHLLLYLAVCHEDRETPVLLTVGIYC